METKIKTTTINRPARKLSKDSKTKQVKPTSKEKLKQLTIVDLSGKETGQMSLPDEIFNVNASDKLLSLYVRVYLNNQKFNAASTKTRGEVKGSTRKIYRQKGTGRARHGANTAPIFVGGGIAHGPRGVIKKLRINKKQRVKALSSALSAKLRDGEIKIITGFEKIEPKTRVLAQSLKVLGDGGKKRKLLLVTPGADAKNVVRAGRNIEGVSILSANMLNAYSVLDTREIFFMKESIDPLVDCFKKEKANG